MNYFLTAFAALGIAGLVHAQTGRQLDIIGDVTEVTGLPSLGGLPFGVAPIVDIFWDERCAKVAYTFNSNVGANPGTPDEISPEQLAATVQAGLDRWNSNPSAYIEMNVTRIADLGARPRIAGDFINEVTFITPFGFTALASSPSTSLPVDATFSPGDDLDGDGDSDVFDPAVAGINECTDIDKDGDIEFPAGDYKAGTILDNDVQFSSTFGWELEASDSGFADVDGVSTHEFGHSHGLSHALINQISSEDGTGSTMFPFIDTTDAVSELAARTPYIDDLAASAFIYPEGSASEGIASLQKGDIAFDKAYDLLEGEVRTAGLPILGANITAKSRNQDLSFTGTASGSSVVFQDVFDINGNGNTEELFVFEESVVDGKFVLPVPAGEVYTASIEALDGEPAAAGNISLNAIVGDILGQTSFPEEGFDKEQESQLEFRPFAAVPFYSSSPEATQLNFETNSEIADFHFEEFQASGAPEVDSAETVIYAEVFDRARVRELFAEGAVPIRATFRTGNFDASIVPTYSRAKLALGRIEADGSATLTQVLREKSQLYWPRKGFNPLRIN